jgi:two-component system, LytTR family, response regulator
MTFKEAARERELIASRAEVLRVLLVDDEPLSRERLRQLLAMEPNIVVVGDAADVVEAQAALEHLKPDLLLLDVQMPGEDGLSLARELSARPGPAVVFVTAFNDFAVEAFEIEALDYLLKPVSGDRLSITLARVRRWRQRGAAAPDERQEHVDGGEGYADCLWVQKKDGLFRVDLTSIDWIEAARDYVLLHTASRCHILRATMDGLARRLNPGVMMRVSRSAFVRIDAVDRLDRQGRHGLVLALSDGAAVKVGATYIKSVEARFGS